MTPLPLWVSLRSSLIWETSCSDSTSDSNWYQTLISQMNEGPMFQIIYLPSNIKGLFVSFHFNSQDQMKIHRPSKSSPSLVPALWTPVSLIHSKMNPYWKYIRWNHMSMSSCSGYLWHSLRWTLSRDWLSTKFRLFRDHISESESLIIRSSWSSE